MEGGSRHQAAESLPPSVLAAIDAIQEHKGEALSVLDMRNISTFTNYLVICSGGVERHVQTIVDAVAERLAAIGVKPLHVEGYGSGRWVLIDCVDLVINVFTPETREFYQLERLWRDAPILLGQNEG